MRSRSLLFVLAGLLAGGLLLRCGSRGSSTRDDRRAPDVQAHSLPAESKVQLESEAGPARVDRAQPGEAGTQGGSVLRGIVLAPNGEPVARAVVYASSPPFACQCRTQSNGRFELRLPADLRGSLQIGAQGGEWDEAEPRSIACEELAEARELRLVLRERGSIRGIALDSLGHPLEGQRVMLDEPSARTGLGVASSEIGPRGEFRFSDVSAGQHVLSAVAGWELQARVQEECAPLARLFGMPEARARVEVRTATESVVNLGGSSPGCVRVHGRVLRGGEPLPGAWVWVEPDCAPGITRLAWAQCDAQGTYELGLQQSGTLAFRIGTGKNAAALTQRVRVPPGDESALDFELACGRISARVVDPEGKPLAWQWVGLVVHESSADEHTPAACAIERASDEEGRVEFDALAPGTYELRAGNREHSHASSGRIRIESGASTREELRLVLGPACLLQGMLTGGPEEPTAGGFVDVFDAGGNYLLRVACDAELHFRSAELAQGSYRLCAHVGALASPLCDPLSISPDAAGWVELALQPATEVLMRVLEDSGTPCAGCREQVRDASGLVLSEGELEGGWASVGVLPRGSFIVSVRSADGRVLEKPIALVGEARLELTLQFPRAEVAR